MLKSAFVLQGGGLKTKVPWMNHVNLALVLPDKVRFIPFPLVFSALNHPVIFLLMISTISIPQQNKFHS